MTPRKGEGCSDRARTSCCVRINDGRGWDCRLNKTGFQSPRKKELFRYYCKRYEQVLRGKSGSAVLRGKSESAVLEKFPNLQSVSERLPPLTALPVDFEDLQPPQKESKLKQLITEQLDSAEKICSESQGFGTQANYPDDMQVDEGRGPDLASQGIANTSPPPDDYSVQHVPLGSIRSEGPPGVPSGIAIDLGSGMLSQLENPEGRPPPSFHRFLDDLSQLRDLVRRASRYPDVLKELQCFIQTFINKLNDRERNELPLDSRSLKEETDSRPREGILAEDPPSHFSKASMEVAGFQVVHYPSSGAVMKNIGTPMPDGEQDTLSRNCSISEALEATPRLRRRLRKNLEDIHPEVYRGSADGDLPSNPMMEGFSTPARDLQVSGHCSGGENHEVNNTSQIVGEARSVLAEQLTEQCLDGDYDCAVLQNWRYLWASPVRYGTDTSDAGDPMG